jgi:type II secretory pathway component GspD/PulD (secretin)
MVPCVLLLILTDGQRAARADEPTSPATQAPKSRRLVIPLRYGSAKELAAVLQKHFQGEAEIQAAPEPVKNSLLVAASGAVYDDVVATVALLDVPQRKVIIDVATFDIVSANEAVAAAKAAEPPLTDRDFTGPVEDVWKQLDAFGKQKRIANLKQMRVETVEGQLGTFQMGEEKPRINGITPTGVPGTVTPQFQQRAVGSILQVTPRIVDSRRVSLDLTFRQDRIEIPDEPLQLGTGPDGPILATEVVTCNLMARLTVPVGQAVLASRVQAESRAKRSQNRVIISARIDETGSEGK